MRMINRRRFLQRGGAAVSALTFWPLVGPVAADTCPALTRYNVASPQGKAMLAIYADAVRKMMDTRIYPEGDPRSWLFQWYTHYVRPDRGKAAELARVYPAGGANQELASQMWSTCQSHDSQPEDYFLPWHRMYVNYFEQIIRYASGKPCFTLPYWDYTDPKQQSIPKEFQLLGDPTWGSLYRETRWAGVNQGANVTSSPPRAALNLECMKATSYSATNSEAGFCANLDGLLHGSLHVDVGNQQGMGIVPWAANDPIFWLHHCNVDRVWASWNKAGGKNVLSDDLKKTPFIFASPDGASVTAAVGDVLSVPASAYDQYLSRPIDSPPFPRPGGTFHTELFSLRAESQETQISGPIVLGSQSVTVTLTGQKADIGISRNNNLFSFQLKALFPKTPLHLSIEGISAHDFVPGVYNVYVHGIEQPAKDPKSAAHVGQINFFGAGMTHHDTERANPNANPKAVSFLLRSETRAYLKQHNTDQPRVTFDPTSGVGVAAQPSIARVRLIA
jgi:tyrosinase